MDLLPPIMDMNSSSPMILMPRSLAFFTFSGPGFSPARRYVVLLLTEELFLPPLAVMRFFMSSRDIENVPVITMFMPLSLSDTGPSVSFISNWSPAALSLSTWFLLTGSAKNARMLSAITSPTSATARRSSREAAIRSSMLRKCSASSLAVDSPT